MCAPSSPWTYLGGVLAAACVVPDVVAVVVPEVITQHGRYKCM